MKYKVNVIIFDFDGVIVDSGDDIANAVQYTLKFFGRPVLAKEEIISYVGRGVEHLIKNSFKSSDDSFIIKQVIPVYKKYYMENAVVETKLYPHVKETLEALKEKKKTALVTNKPEALALKILEVLGVRDLFNVVVGPESVSSLKPDPEGILKVLQVLEEEPRNSLMVGDSNTDVEAGKNAGTFTCGVTYGIGDVEELLRSSPDFLIDDMIRLLDYIE